MTLRQLEKLPVWYGRLDQDVLCRPPHGLWTLGDTLPPEHPGHTKWLRYFTGCAYPAMFGETETIIGMDGRTTLFLVMQGSVKCEFGDGSMLTAAYPHAVHLPARMPYRMSWSQASEKPPRAFALGRELTRDWPDGNGPHYEFHVFDVNSLTGDSVPLFLSQPEQLKRWSHAYVEIFDGAATINFAKHPLCLNPNVYAYLSAEMGAGFDWRLAAKRVRGVMIYYNRSAKPWEEAA